MVAVDDESDDMVTLRIRIPKEGFLEIAAEADAAGEFERSLTQILRLLPMAARERNAKQTHLLTVSLHAFLYHKGGSYPLTLPLRRHFGRQNRHATQGRQTGYTEAEMHHTGTYP